MGVKILTFTLMFLWISHGFSQNEQPNVIEYNHKNYKKALAVWQIEDLHNGVLLVRLSTKQNTIKAMVSAGYDEKASKVEKELDLFNASIIQGFKTTFDFCDVYFFESTYSEYVVDAKFDEIPFVDSLIVKETNSKNLENLPVFVAEFSSLQPDTVRLSENRMPPNTNLGISALVVKSNLFIQLMNPFPYYVRAYDEMPALGREPPQSIAKLNEKLHEFYLRKDDIKIKKRKRYRK